ncbi:PEP-CTERM sorting domain-containing protein [Okeania sp.]|uniref:PEP-CTERM sorting domain-containing protein n=1 Tax=Okeania sp. TaxID=3100323 RepID=UPI002B4ADD0E|nr:PEP-CTERM sorting domain-containing protein [Okeania sp.]MEB3342947.1 PEP-CTERM sorting domain-containing protein [Okeania sp.]
MAGLSTSSSAFVTFDVFNDGGLFSGANDFSFLGDINIVAYQGNNFENIYDYQATSIGTVGTFNTAGLSVGDTLSFDITSIFNDAISNGWSSLGIRLESATNPQGAAWTFDNFHLTNDNQSTNLSETVPEPTSVLGLLAVGAVGVGSMLKRK